MKKTTTSATTNKVSINICFNHVWQNKAFKDLGSAFDWCVKHAKAITWVGSIRTMHQPITKDAMEIAFA